MSIEIFRVDTAYDAQGNSPWDTIWYDGDDEDIDSLACAMRLAPIWKAPRVRVQRRIERPDVYCFQLNWAINARGRKLLLPLVEDTVEFLSLTHKASDSSLFAIHPLLRVSLDDRAAFRANKVSGNITDIRKYSFAKHAFDEPTHLFQVTQALRSSARDAGYPFSDVLVSRELKDLCEGNGIRGVTFEKVFSE